MDEIKISKVEDVLLNWRPNTWNIQAPSNGAASNGKTVINAANDHKASLHLTVNDLIIRYVAYADGLPYEIWIPYSNVASLKRNSVAANVITDNSNPLSYYSIVLNCRDFTFFRLLVSSAADAQAVYETISRALDHQGASLTNSYAFSFQHVSKTNSTAECNGWEFYDPFAEFERMGVGSDNGSAWRISDVNAGYNLCPTYPRILVVPTKISDAVLYHAAKFRSRGRLPALSYLHRQTGASITRSSQPLVGIKSKRSIQDEKLIESIFESNHDSSDNHHNFIIDARPVSNAMANRAMGAGTESLENYRNCDRLFMGIDNIHVMRDSLNKLVEVCSQPDAGVDRLYSGIDSSGWLKHIRNIMESALLIVKAIENGQNVLIHCSDGWDRTAQLSGLASICLDPFYRTLKGFQILIEKEWLSFGHKFSERCGHVRTMKPKTSSSATQHSHKSGSKEEKETSPVFLQFLESTRNLMLQFPGEFEYNEMLLLDLHKYSQNCQFGTFLGNCERERLELQLKTKTVSVWNHVLDNISIYTSALYSPSGQHVLRPSVSPKDILLWNSMYCAWDKSAFGACITNNHVSNNDKTSGNLDENIARKLQERDDLLAKRNMLLRKV